MQEFIENYLKYFFIRAGVLGFWGFGILEF